MSTKDAVDFCRSCGGELSHVPLPGCDERENHATEDE